EKIDVPDGGGVEMWIEAFHGGSSLGGPCFFNFVDTYATLQATFQVLKRATDDFQIDPKTVGAYFKFLVAAQLFGIRLQENFRDIAVPKLIAATTRVSIINDGDETIARDKFQIEKFGRPEETNCGLAMRIGILPLPVCVEEHGLGAAPRIGRRETGGIKGATERRGEGRGTRACVGGG